MFVELLMADGSAYDQTLAAPVGEVTWFKPDGRPGIATKYRVEGGQAVELRPHIRCGAGITPGVTIEKGT
jgi:hypothetical protein